MKWSLRIAQFVIALHKARQTVSWWKMVRAILSGPVPRSVWRQRLRYGCFICPIFDHEFLRCSSVHPQLLGHGCQCYLPLKCLSAEPYVGGCWGRAVYGPDFGWGAYRFPSVWARIAAPVRFLLGK